MSSTTFSSKDVQRIAGLAKIPVGKVEEKELTSGFNTTIRAVDELFTVEIKGVEPTHQVTGLENVFREDEPDPMRTFTQEQALSNAPKTYNGYFVVDQVIAQEE